MVCARTNLSLLLLNGFRFQTKRKVGGCQDRFLLVQTTDAAPSLDVCTRLNEDEGRAMKTAEQVATGNSLTSSS
jgi:hypothetical protein